MNSEYKRVEYSLMYEVCAILLGCRRYCAPGQAGTPFWISLDKAESRRQGPLSTLCGHSSRLARID
jgi:hypothetical protein